MEGRNGGRDCVSTAGTGGVGVSDRSFFPLAPRLKRAFKAPVLFLSDKPEVFLSSCWMGKVLATPRVRCCSL